MSSQTERLPAIIIFSWLGSIVVLFILHKLINNLTDIQSCIRLNIILIGILLLLLLPVEPVLYICCLFWRQCVQYIHQETRDNLHEMFGLGIMPIFGISLMIYYSSIDDVGTDKTIYQLILWVSIVIFVVGYLISVSIITKTGRLGCCNLNNAEQNDAGGNCCFAFFCLAPSSIICAILLTPLHIIILLSVTHDFVVELMNKINASFSDFDVLDNNHHQQFWSLRRRYNDMSQYCNFGQFLCGLIGWIVYFPLTVFAAICYGVAHIAKDAFIFPRSMLIIPTLTSLTFLISSTLYWSDIMRDDEWYIFPIYVISALILAISSIFLGILYYHIHEGSFTSNNIVLIAGLFIIGPIQLLMLPYWTRSILNISLYLYDIISINIRKAMGIYNVPQNQQLLGNNDEMKIEASDIERSGEVSQILSHISLSDTEMPGATKRASDVERTRMEWCRIFELFIILPFLIISYILLPLSYIIEPMKNFRFQCFIMPFSFSMLFWISFIFWIYDMSEESIESYIWLILWICFIIFLFLLSIREDPKLLRKLDIATWTLRFPFLFIAYIVSAPCIFLGIYWWPNLFIYQARKCYKIIKQDKTISDELSFKFWRYNQLFVMSGCCKVFAMIFFIILLPLTMLMMIIWFISIPTRSIIQLPIIYWIITIIMSLAFWFSIILSIYFDPLNKQKNINYNQHIEYWNEYAILIGFILIYILIFAILLTKRNLHDHCITKCMQTITTIIGIIFFVPTLCASGYYISWYYFIFANSLI